MKYLKLILLLCIYTSYAKDNLQNSVCYNDDCMYEFLLKRWYDGANGQGQGSVDSAVLKKVSDGLTKLKPSYKDHPETRKVIEDLQRYRGLGIFLGYYVSYSLIGGVYETDDHNCSVIAKVLKEYYNIDIDIKRISGDNHRQDYMGYWKEQWYLDLSYEMVSISGLPDYDKVIFLTSSMTREVLSIHKYKIRYSPKDSSARHFFYGSLLREWKSNSIEQRLPPWSRWRLNIWGRIPETKKNINCATALTIAAGAATEYSGSKMTPLWGMPIQYNYEEDHWIVSCAKDTSRLHDYYREKN